MEQVHLYEVIESAVVEIFAGVDVIAVLEYHVELHVEIFSGTRNQVQKYIL